MALYQSGLNDVNPLNKHGCQGAGSFFLYVHVHIYTENTLKHYCALLKIIWHKLSLVEPLQRLLKLI